MERSQTSGKDSSKRYQYDIYGNMLYKSGAGHMAYDSQSNRLQSLTQDNGKVKNYSYDANGNMLTAGDKKLTWISLNQRGDSIDSLMYCSDTTLYGRYWGCTEHVDALHFEACYYQGIDYCIQHGLQRFEPGAQGEHKIARGFVPTLTRSSHWLAENPFQVSIENFVKHEKEATAQYIDDCMQRSPYREL